MGFIMIIQLNTGEKLASYDSYRRLLSSLSRGGMNEFLPLEI